MNLEPNALDQGEAEMEVIPAAEAKDELTLLKERARKMNITFSNNIKVDALREKIEAVMNGNKTTKAEPETDEGGNSIADIRNKVYLEAMKLVRIRITNMNPAKASLFGEFFTVANRYIGTVTKYVPYNEASQEGYHVPHCIYEALKEKEYLHVRTKTNPRTGAAIPETKYVKEFAIEVLPPLSEKELKDLALAQAAAGSIEPTNT